MQLHFTCHVGCRRSSSSATCTAAAFSLSWMFLLLSWRTRIGISSGFSFSTSMPSRIVERRQRHSLQHLRPLSSMSNDDDGNEANRLPTLKGSLSGSKLHEYTLKEHKPLGCSVEESLAKEPENAKYVFVAGVMKGGNAARAGLREGDVIVQLSGTFDEVVDVAGLGIERIRSLVGGRPKENPLTIRVARGTDIMTRHQLALAELCIVGDDAETADCITSIFTADNDLYMEDNIATEICDEDDGTECMLDSMWDAWTEGLPTLAMEEDKNDAVVEKDEKKKAAPWSSRSSPSGTYVRDPKTGKLVNIDE